jgi:hypothetical protein
MEYELSRGRPYIERMRTDPRFYSLVRSWCAQSVIETQLRFDNRRCDAEVMHEVADAALKLALEFILYNDGEYKAVYAERNAALEANLDLIKLMPRPLLYDPNKDTL